MLYLCPQHGKQAITYDSIKQGKGCSKCGRKKANNSHRTPFNVVEKAFSDIGYTLLSTEFIDQTTALLYSCPIHGEHSIRYADLIRGKRCPQCNVSKGEQSIQEWLDYHCVTYATQYTFVNLISERKLKFDFVVFDSDGKTIKLLIEFQGRQHYMPVDFAGRGKEWAEEQFTEGQRRDQLKVDYCKLHKIPLLTIKYSEFSLLEDILDKAINNTGDPPNGGE